MNGDTSLAHLTVVIDPSCIDSGTAGAYLAMGSLARVNNMSKPSLEPMP